MKALQINEEKAKKLYKNSTPEFKEMLHDTFGEKFFSEKITDKVKSYLDACEILHINPRLIDISAVVTDHSSIIAYSKLCIIARALNEGWVPDWKNSSQPKYVPYFDLSGSGVSYFYCVTWFSHSCVGSRLVFKSRELAEYAAKQFIKEYTDFLTL